MALSHRFHRICRELAPKIFSSLRGRDTLTVGVTLGNLCRNVPPPHGCMKSHRRSPITDNVCSGGVRGLNISMYSPLKIRTWEGWQKTKRKTSTFSSMPRGTSRAQGFLQRWRLHRVAARVVHIWGPVCVCTHVLNVVTRACRMCTVVREPKVSVQSGSQHKVDDSCIFPSCVNVTLAPVFHRSTGLWSPRMPRSVASRRMT